MFKTPYSKADWVVTFLATAMFCSAGWCHWRKQRLLTHGVHVQGDVVNTNRHLGGRNGFYYVSRPFVSYKDATGKSWTLDPGFDTTQEFKVGQTLPVVYDPADPGGGEVEPGCWNPPHMAASGDFLTVGLLLLVPLAGLRLLESGPVRKRAPANPAGP